ncbi:hypothetical protein [Polluticoccus soli]|uniref:hypothetical protein n=1 Tax=Polluticoccus soli TaxID=3034150 RepID=UPI0023E2F027|nr:hypothetical protein [Flavipsychrobacter sp. JY13-12]
MLGVIIVLMLISPLIIYILGGIVGTTRKVVINAADELTKPAKGRYNTAEVNLLSFLSDSKTYKFYFQMRLENSERYLMLGHLSESYDISTYKSTYIIVPHHLDRVLQRELPEIYSNETIRGESLFKLLKFLLNQTKIIKYTDYPKDKNYHFKFTEPHNSAKKYDDSYIQKLFDTVENFRNIYSDYSMTKLGYQSNYLKLIKEHNWEYNEISWPKGWKIEYDTREYRIASESLMDTLYR